MSGKEKRRRRNWLFSLRRYLTFFVLMAFVITCCMLLFLNTMTRATGLELSQEYVEAAAKVTFLNILLLTLVCTLIDGLRRKWMVGRPVRKIIKAAEQITQGDFSARVPDLHSLDAGDGFGEIGDCFNKMAQELSGTETLRTDFIANVSHELKTPLAVIQNYGTMLQQPGLSEEKRLEYAKAVTDASRRLANLITNILKLNKLENQQIFPQAETYDLGEQLCQCLLAFENAWEEKGLDIQTDIQENVLVEADSELLSLVWNNLFSNAVKFTEPGGTLSLTLEAQEDLAVVRVGDTGCGIPPEVGKHIFEKFYQGDTSHATEGNGLGLALVLRILRMMGGSISVTSAPGEGSTFTVRLPVRAGQGEQRETKTGPKERQNA